MTVCAHCGATDGVQLEPSRTIYHYEIPPPNVWDHLLERKPDLPPDPNADVWLCRECAEEHHRYWDDMWDQVNYDRM